MKTIYLRTHSIERIFEQFQKQLGGKLTNSPDEYQLELNNSEVSGVINGLHLKNNLTFLEYDVVFSEDTRLISHSPATNPIYFLYCAKGSLRHSFGDTQKQHTIHQFQAGIFSCQPSKDAALYFNKGAAVRGIVITVATKGEKVQEGDVDLLRENVLQTFMPKADKATFTYISSYNLKISDQIQQLDAIPYSGVIRNLIVRGIVHTILAMEIYQHEEDTKNQYAQSLSLNRSELEEIKELSQFIRNYPDKQFTIAWLVRESGMSPAKLQEGFKFLHQRTVTDFVRSVRLEYAETLIKTTDLNISEIVYSVGLTSRSYFSKIFREKYNCCPKYYKENQLGTLASA